ncbi:unnamed protein product [Owenia fusiformis]|uniref:Uncharacterized protein n=1 Tax=Owenia fusiformis TaxID=6347 RepID=A0A8J1US49_OWEFU|nr:unnamed protein product [Owenia fusiformis]
MSKAPVRAGGLSGKVAVITAGSTGIGFAIARRLAQDGAHVVISSRNQKHVDDAVKALKEEGLRASGIVCHVGKAEDRLKLINETVRTLGGLDILVSNAAVNPTFGPVLQTTETVWDKIFDVNLKGTFFLIKEAAPHIENRGGGSVILVSSQGGYIPSEFLAAYSVSKTAMLGLTKALVPQLSQMNIRVNAIAPGVIKTNFSGALWKDPSVSDEIAARIPMKRLGVPDECAGAVSFLVSSDASYITGETIVMNGGSQSRL